MSEGGPEWGKDKRNRPMQHEDEYRLHMELNRCLKKESDPDLFVSQTTRTVSSRGSDELLPAPTIFNNLVIWIALFVFVGPYLDIINNCLI